MAPRISNRRTSTKVHGLAELRRALAELPTAYSRDILKAVMFRRMERMMRVARGMAPVKSGALRNSIFMTDKTPRDERKRSRSSVAVYMGTDNAIAPFQEFGTVNHPPSPFMRPAWDGGKNDLVEGLADDIWAEIAARLRSFQK